MPFDQPGAVAGFAEREQRPPQRLDGFEGLHPQQVLFQSAYKALGTAIAFRSPDEGGRTLDAEKGQFLLEVIGNVLRSVIVAHRQTVGDRLRKPAKILPHTLADRLRGLEAGSRQLSL